ncbi:MAG: ribonuclease R [Legionellales bacterium]|nr:ribonuclease R [Legionellales bacterium]
MTKHQRITQINDPYHELEAKRYRFPIPSREFILQFLQEKGSPVAFEIMLEAFGITESAQEDALQKRLNAMLRDGQLMRNRRGNYGLVAKMNLMRGRVIAQKEGHGFVRLDNSDDRYYLDPKQMRLVFDGDHVLIRKTDVVIHDRNYAIVVEILERGIKEFIGRLFSENGIIYLTPNNTVISHDILIPPEHMNGARVGQIVAVECLIPDVPNFRRAPTGKVLTILGNEISPQEAVNLTIHAHALRHEWPELVMKECQAFEQPLADPNPSQRVDLRRLHFVTIDGQDAKDFDDAVYAELAKDGSTNLFVAIADVSFYVKPHTALDTEALARGNSAYFPNRVVPMLPEILSNGLCSLKPLVDRFTLVCEANISANGRVKRYRFYRAVICSHARLTYDEVAQVVEQNADHPFKTDLMNLYQVYQQLLGQRFHRGAIDFDFPEARVIVENDHIKTIVASQRNEAHRLIEECMLVANVCAADLLIKHKQAGIFRIHAQPKQEKLTELRQLLSELGLKLGGQHNPTAQDFTQLLATIKQREDSRMLETIILRSMCQAVYSEKNIGHFALAYPAYTHFTSPIRRYPDLLVHRALLATLQQESFHYTAEKVAEIAAHCSHTERAADEAGWDVIAWLKCRFMQDKVGQTFTGQVSSVTPFGIFILLDHVFVEGLVHVTALRNDYYHYDAIRHQLKGERSGQVYRIGDKVTVLLARVNLDEKQIDFDLAGNGKSYSGKKSKKINRNEKKKRRKKRR